MKGYIAGPMRGYAQFNFPMFDEVTKAWVAEGNEAVSPADHDRAVLAERGLTPEAVPGFFEGDLALYEKMAGGVYDLLAWDFWQISMECDSIVLLPGWEKSTGAKAERFVAETTEKLIFLAWKYGDTWVIMPDVEQKRMTLAVNTEATLATVTALY